MAVIELDLDAAPAPPPRRPPARWYRITGLALAGLLTLTLGGAVPVPVAVWRHLGVLPLGAMDSSFALAGGGIYTVEAAAGGKWRTTAWAEPALRPAWSVTTGSARDGSDGAGFAGVNLTAAGRELLIQDPAGTTVVDTAGGAVRWAGPGPLYDLGSGLGVTVETWFRPGTEYDVAGGAPGDLFFSATGRPHTEPPRRTTLHGVQIATGRRLWSSEQRGSVRVARAAGDAAAVVVAAADRLTVLAGDTGAVLRSVPLPRADAVAWVEFVGDLLLIRRGRLDEPGTLSAYALDTLAFRWQVADRPDGGDQGFCSGLPCASGPSGRLVLDARTGRPAWRIDDGVSVVLRAGAAVEASAAWERPVRVRDVSTGAVRVRLAGWDAAVNREGDGPMVVRRADTGRGVTAFGALRPGGSAVRPLGVAGEVVDDCVADARFVACRTPDGLHVWSYRA